MSESQKQTLEIEALVSRRCDELGLSPKGLIRRCGYKNVLAAWGTEEFGLIVTP